MTGIFTPAYSVSKRTGSDGPDTRGDPESPLRWTCKSTAQLAGALTAAGHPVSDDTVGRLLKQQGYTLQRTEAPWSGGNMASALRPSPVCASKEQRGRRVAGRLVEAPQGGAPALGSGRGPGVAQWVGGRSAAIR
jgi:hypothetical protein